MLILPCLSGLFHGSKKGGEGRESSSSRAECPGSAHNSGIHRHGLKVSGSATEISYASASSSITMDLLAVSVIGSLKELNETKHAVLSHLDYSAQ